MNSRLFVVAGYILIILMIPLCFVIAKLKVDKMGKRLFELPKKSFVSTILVVLAALGFLTVLMFRDFGLMSVILVACAVLGVYLMVRDNHPYNGVYENGIILASQVVFFKEIVTFPVLQLPPEEQAHYPKNVITVVTASKPKVDLIFNSEEECTKVMELLKELNVI